MLVLILPQFTWLLRQRIFPLTFLTIDQCQLSQFCCVKANLTLGSRAPQTVLLRVTLSEQHNFAVIRRHMHLVPVNVFAHQL